MNPDIAQDIKTSAARLAHEVNRAYCSSIGDDSQVSWEEAPQWQRDSCASGVAFHIANPDAGDAGSHENWMKDKIADGWVYGDKKCPDSKTHHCLVPFNELPKEQQIKDTLFRAVVHAVIPSHMFDTE